MILRIFCYWQYFRPSSFFLGGVVFCVFCLWLLIIARYELPSKPPSSRFSSLCCGTNYVCRLLIANMEQTRKPLVPDQLLLACMSVSLFSFFLLSSFCASNFGVRLGLQVTGSTRSSLIWYALSAKCLWNLHVS